MKNPLVITALVMVAISLPAFAQQTASKPPVGVPNDATFFNGKWYKVYLEKTPWTSAKTKCERLGGQLAIVPDARTQAFVQQLSNKLALWLGASEKVEGLWMWVDGTRMDYTAWSPGEPDNSGNMLNPLLLWKGNWYDDAGKFAVGFICEWKAK